MKDPWMKYKFGPEERERINEVEEWAIEHEEEIGFRIVYLEELVKFLSEPSESKGECDNEIL